MQVKGLVQCLARNWELLLFTGKNGENGGSQKKKKRKKERKKGIKENWRKTLLVKEKLT